MKGVYSILYTIGISFAVMLILYLCLNLLPDSPFQSYLAYESNGEFVSYLKFALYFLPIDRIIAVLEAWLSVMIMWYTFRFSYKAVDKVISGSSGIIGDMVAMLKK